MADKKPIKIADVVRVCERDPAKALRLWGGIKPQAVFFMPDAVPIRHRRALASWITLGIGAGPLLEAILSNDLMRTMARIGPDDAGALKGMTSWMFTNLPVGSFGSRTNYSRWQDMGGMLGRAGRVEIPTEAEEGETR